MGGRADCELRQPSAQLGRESAAGTFLERHGDLRSAASRIELVNVRKNYTEGTEKKIQRERKFLRSCLPEVVRTDSGWNWTPSTLYFLWRTPMMMPSAVSAVTLRSRGS